MSTSNLDENPPSSTNHLKLIYFSLRLSVIPLSVATIWLSVTNHQDNSSYGKLEFSNFMGLKYMVCIAAYLLVTSGAAVQEILYLAYNGDKEVTWSEACTSYGKFCNKMKVALVLHALTLCCFLFLAVISAYRAFSMFEPPHSNSF